MGKSSGGVRGSSKTIVAFRETDKAILVEWRGAMTSRYGSKFAVQPRELTQKVWLPKSQIIEGNRIPKWLAIDKNVEMMQRIGASERYSVGGKLYDANGREIGVGFLKAKKAAQKERTQLMKSAKAQGYEVRRNLKTSTLRQMANGTYKK